MFARWRGRSRDLALGALLALLATVARSQATLYPFDLPAQPLAESLRAVGHLTSTNVMFEPRLVKDLHAPALRAQATAAEVLRKLLEGTQLSAVQTAPDSFLIQASAPDEAAGASGQATGIRTGSSQDADGAIRMASDDQDAPGGRPPVAGSDDGQHMPATIQELIVTAERLGRSVRDTSTSVVVLDADALAQRATDGIKDLIGGIPNIATTGRSSLAPSVRGVDGTGPAYGADAFFAGTRPRLNIQVDGRPASYNEVVFGDFGVWDLQQVEVLRGPQSTLQGRNSIAGTIAVKTADPAYDLQGRARVFAGNYDTRQYSAALSAPIVDGQLAFRLSADHRTHESFVDFTPFPGSKDPGRFESNVYRAKLLIEPGAMEGFSALLTVNHTDSTGTQSEAVTQPYGEHGNRFDLTSAVFEPSSTSGILDLHWKASDAVRVQTLVSYSDLDIERRARPGNGNATIDGHELVAEPSVTFHSPDQRIKALFGAYLFRASQDELIDLFGGGGFDDRTRTNAVFGEATYAFSERFDVTVGARYEEERRQREGSIFLFTIDLDEKYETFLPKLVLSWHPSAATTVGALVTRGYNGGSAGFTYFQPFRPYTFDPEYVWNYEGFARALLAGGRLTLSGNLFYSDYEDMQLPFYLSSVSTIVANADKVTTRGAEVMAAWQPSRALRIHCGLGTIKSDIRRFPGSGVQGNELPRSPKFSGSVGVYYAHPRGFDFSFDARHSGRYYSSIVNDPLAKVGSYWIASTQLGDSFRNVKVFGYVRNLFDSQDPLIITPGDTFGAGYAQIVPPRTYGAGVQVNL